MRLRRVVISGFKTFARRTEIRLEPGITAIVGPNGSGKSNLVDAVRWALGETNARELRGARMDEVIYSGGDGRGRMGFADVELVLDNEDGRLGVDDAEVSISRRVARHGDSDFRLNGDRVRLRDLERLLGTTGLTQTGYAVVAQNDIDAIIEASPAQRRALVEQAAGVRSLRAACEDALGRVSGAEVTLQRFDDLLGETEPRLAELAGQAALALEQRELTEQLTRLRGSLAREAWRGARGQLRQAQRRLGAADSRLEAAATAEKAFAGGLARHRSHLEAQRTLQADAGGRLEQARLQAERARGDERRGSDRVRAGAALRAQAAADTRAARAQLTARTESVNQLRSAGQDAFARREALSGLLDIARQRHDATLERQGRADRDAVEADLGLVRAEDARAAADADARRCATEFELFTGAALSLDQRAAAGRARVADLGERAGAAVTAEAAAAIALAGAEAARAQAVEALHEARAMSERVTGELDAAREASRAAVARAATVRGQVDGALGGRGVIAEAVGSGDLVAHRLVDTFTVIDPADAPAVEAALEHHLGAWVVDDLGPAAALLGSGGAAREELRLRAAPGPHPVPSPPDGARSAVDAVRAVEGFEAAVAGCLAGAWLIADADTAVRIVSAAGGRAVLPDGTVITTTGLRGGGRPGRTLELAATEREAAHRASLAMDVERSVDRDRRAAQEGLARAETAHDAAADRVQSARLSSVEAAAHRAAAAGALAGEEQRLAEMDAELRLREGERGALEDAGAAAAARLAVAENAVAAARAAATSAHARLAVARAATDAAAQALGAVEADAAENTLVTGDHDRRLTAAADAVREAEARLAAADDRLLSAELAVVGGIARCCAAARSVATLDELVEVALRELHQAAPDLAESERAVAALEAERAEVAVVLARAEDEEAAARSDVEAAQRRVADLAEAVRDDEEDEGPEPQAGDAERAEREIVRLERRVAALGPVNALAPEQHDHLALRVAVLRSGRDDLGTACADIRAMAARLTGEIDRRFDAVFGAVSVHFHELFAELFPGGRATLRREEVPATDDEPVAGRRDQLRAGVEILAQPPGKKLQPLSLLSGGERALTALAVILALQQVTPSPFYVFDEVDAPLDDSNVVRFSRLLTRLAATQQFIIVTHNHVTMAAADALHGVTSDTDGVSSVISVRFDADAGETVPEGNVVGLRQSTIRAAV